MIRKSTKRNHVRGDLCWKGLHDLNDPDNVIVKPDGTRQCRPCKAAARKVQNPKPRGLPGDTCYVPGCDRPRRPQPHGRYRYCLTHQKRLINNGDVYADVPIDRRNAGTSLQALRERLAR